METAAAGYWKEATFQACVGRGPSEQALRFREGKPFLLAEVHSSQRWRNLERQQQQRQM